MKLTLTIDIGGSGVKAMVLDDTGKPVTERNRIKTPQPPKPEAIIETIIELAAQQGDFHRISVGFPGVVRQGVTYSAVNLDSDWVGFDLATALSQRLEKPTKVVNDADMQGFGAISGQGVELVITLGTGFGSALFSQGKLVPNLEAGHHVFHKGKTYEQLLGRAGMKKDGKKKWNHRLKKALKSLEHLFNCNTLYIGGGEAKNINFDLPSNVKIVPNVAGLLGGIALWRD